MFLFCLFLSYLQVAIGPVVGAWRALAAPWSTNGNRGFQKGGGSSHVKEPSGKPARGRGFVVTVLSKSSVLASLCSSYAVCGQEVG